MATLDPKLKVAVQAAPGKICRKRLLRGAGAGLCLLFSLAAPALANTREEVELAGGLRNYAFSEKDFGPALGNKPFTGKYTGLADPRPYLRQEAAKIIADLGDSRHLEALTRAIEAEQDPAAKRVMGSALRALQYRIEQRLLEEICGYTEKSGDLSVLLGEAPFAGRPKTGLQDPNPLMRAMACYALEKFGSSSQMPLLLQQARKEDDRLARDQMYLAYLGLGLQRAPDKDGFVRNFLQECLILASSKKGAEAVPRRALARLFKEAEPALLQGCAGQLDALEEKLSCDAPLSELLKENRGLRELEAGLLKKGLTFEDFFFSQPGHIQEWALRALLKENSARAQQRANEILLKLLARKDKGVFILKELMLAKGILRSENPNACLEFGGSFPEGWQAQGPDRLVYPEPGAYSYARCLGARGVKQKAVLATERRVEFSGKLPWGVEYGLMYKYSPGNEAAAAAKEGEAAAGLAAAKIILRLKVALEGGADKEAQTEAYVLPEEGQWQRLRASYAPEPAAAIGQARLEVIVLNEAGSGQAGVLLDDIFLRRPEAAFNNSAPVIGKTEISPDFALLKPVRLGRKEQALCSGLVKFSAAVSDPDGDRVAGRWSSDLEGDLGEGLEKKARFSRPGRHKITFSAKDEFGRESRVEQWLDVLNPRPELFWPAGGQGKKEIILGLKVGGIEEYRDKLKLKAYLYCGRKLVALARKYPFGFKLSRSRLPKPRKGGLAFQAKVVVSRPGEKAVYLSPPLSGAALQAGAENVIL